MRPSTPCRVSFHLGICAGVILLCTPVLAAPGTTGVAAGHRGVLVPASHSRTTSSPCLSGLIRDVVLPRAVAVDEIVVVLQASSPAGGAAAVEVAAGHGGRAMTVQGVPKQHLVFSPPLSARTFHVALLPVFTARADACVERIELRSAGRRVANVRP